MIHCDRGDTTLDDLRAGDDAAFVRMVRSYYPSMLRTAEVFVRTTPSAEDVVQDTWMAVLRGLPKFEGRSSLKTWIFQILINRAKSQGTRERRVAAFESLDRQIAQAGAGSGARSWVEPTSHWSGPDEEILTQEAEELVLSAIATLPTLQAQVIMLRHVERFSTAEVCQLLDITSGNQRILLHRGRARLRQLLLALHEPAADAVIPQATTCLRRRR